MFLLVKETINNYLNYFYLTLGDGTGIFRVLVQLLDRDFMKA